MRLLIAFLVTGGLVFAQSPELARRIKRTDPSQYGITKNVHVGAGEVHYMPIVDACTLSSNLPFDNEAEFTIDGRTSLLKGPAGAPLRMGHSHAIYNLSDEPVQFMNISVGSAKGEPAVLDFFNLGDDRVGAPLDPKPVFMHILLKRDLLEPTTD